MNEYSTLLEKSKQYPVEYINRINKYLAYPDEDSLLTIYRNKESTI